jgi:two-component system sensor histidine kinase KdpD
MRVVLERLQAGSLPAYMLAVVAATVPAVMAAPWHQYWGATNVAMLFLLATALSAVWLGRGPAVVCAALGVALFDLFFVEPRFSFSVQDARYLVTFAVMLVVALVISYLVSTLRSHASDAIARERQMRELYQLASSLTAVMANTQLTDAVKDFAHGSVGAQVLLLLVTPDESLAGEIDEASLDATDRLAAIAAHRHGTDVETAMLACGERSGIFVPLVGATRNRGVLGFVVPQREFSRLQQLKPMLLAASSIVAAAIERLHFVDVANTAEREISNERLRSSILSALSHDIRTPLAALYGLADSLTLLSPPLPQPAQESLAALRAQTLQLNALASNLLDMARLQAGPVVLHKEWQPLEEIVGASIQSLRAVLASRHVRVDLPHDLPLVAFDAVLMERVLCNLLDNACKYSPVGSDIAIGATLHSALVEVQVRNAGAGFPAGRLQAVFDPFERGNSGIDGVHGRDIAGSGIGLTICRAIVEAHGGTISAANPAEGGACVAFVLPLGEPPAIEPESDFTRPVGGVR